MHHSALLSVLDLTPNAVFIKDVEGRYVYVNAAAAAFVGRCPAEIVGLSDLDLYPPATAADFAAADRAVLASGRPCSFENVAISASGRREIYFVTKGVYRGADGKAAGVYGISVDITEQRRAEETSARFAEIQRARDAAIESDRLKSEFLANISHEIRTPLNGVMGMTSLVLDTAVSEYQRECLLSVQSSASALLTIVNDILDLSKIASGHVRLDAAPLALRTLLQRVTAPFAPQALAKGLHLTTTIAPDVPDDYVADGGRLRQVLTNLIGNALKFTHEGGVSIAVTCHERIADAARLSISVADTGIGIPPAALDLVFEPFRQADGSTTRAYGGTGLGLTISRRIIEMMGGRLWVESIVGIGSTFHVDVSLPLAHAPAADTATPASRPAARPLRVLLAEDNVVNQRVAMGLLMARGHHVTVAHNGQEALDAVARSQFDVVLMDVQMPVMGGFEACQAIRAAERATGTRLRIVALTAHAMTGDRERCLAAGMDAIVTKPVHREVLYDAVEAIDKPLHA